MTFATRKPIKVLKDSVARKIAAGEVIDRPGAVIRELLDNALDSGATQISIRWEAGGLRSLEVTDNGQGMDRADLELCWLPHTTSKIEVESDLETLSSFGFRGEALGSIAACSRLTIVSSQDQSGPAHQLTVEDGHDPAIKVVPGMRGTKVLVEDLFANFPARRKFMKSPGTESNVCRKVLEEKALSAPSVAFTLWIDSIRKLDFPSQTEAQRTIAVLGSPWAPQDLLNWTAEAEGFKLRGYALKPPQSRSDRKGIRVYANQRPLQEFALVQALSYAFEGYLPGGVYPLAVLFLEVDPSLVDFNIHPAKREARFRTLPAIHQKVVESLRSALEPENLRFPNGATDLPLRDTLGFEKDPKGNSPIYSPPPQRGRAQLPSVATWDPVHDLWEEVREPGTEDRFRYLGQVLGVFLVAEVGDNLYLVDQHAAHERILFDAFRNHGGRIQELLFPRRFTPNEEIAPLLKAQWKDYQALGIRVQPVSGQEFELRSLPQTVVGLEKTVIDFLSTNNKPVGDLEKDLYASLSCRAAVMDGDPLDPSTARDLLRKTFALKNARCPHGRPIWTVITRQELFEKVGRVV